MEGGGAAERLLTAGRLGLLFVILSLSFFPPSSDQNKAWHPLGTPRGLKELEPTEESLETW